MTQKKTVKVSYEKLKTFIDNDHLCREVYDHGFLYQIYELDTDEVGIDCYAVFNDDGFNGVFEKYTDAIVAGELSLSKLLELIDTYEKYDIYPEKTEWNIN